LDLQYHQRLCDYLNTYERAFVVGADNVGSKQMSDIRAVRIMTSSRCSPDHVSSSTAAGTTALLLLGAATAAAAAAAAADVAGWRSAAVCSKQELNSRLVS
jgi:hypothetical protein